MTVPGLRHHCLTRLSHSQAGCQIHRHLPCISPDYRLAGVFHVKSWRMQDLGHHQTFVVQVWSPSLETPLPLECPVWRPSYLQSAGECPAQATWDTAEPAATGRDTVKKAFDPYQVLFSKLQRRQAAETGLLKKLVCFPQSLLCTLCSVPDCGVQQDHEDLCVGHSSL